MARLPGELTLKQKRYVQEYLRDMSAERAARRAGYESTVVSHNPLVKDAIQHEMDELAAEAHVDLAHLLVELLQIARVDPAQMVDPDTGALLPLHKMPVHVRKAISSVDVEEMWAGKGEEREQVGVVKKVKLWGKLDAIDKLMKHLGAYAADKLEVSGAVTLRDLLPGAKLPEKVQAAPAPTLDDELNGET